MPLLFGGSRRGWISWTALSAGGALSVILSLTLRSFSTDRPSAPPSSFSLEPTKSTPPALPLAIDPGSADLGTLGPRQPAKVEFTIRNLSSLTVVIDRIETTCPCIQAVPASCSLGADECRPLTVNFDPAHDPDFRGSLSVAITGIGDNERTLFHFRVMLEVRDGNPLQEHP